VALALEVAYERDAGAHLCGGWPRVLEIAHEADAHGFRVPALGVRARALLGPAESHLDFPVAGLRAVADHEVVAQPPPALLQVPAVERGGRTGRKTLDAAGHQAGNNK